MLTHIINQYDFNLAFAKQLVKDLSVEQMTMSSGKGLVNHPAFTLGHLVSGSAMMAEDLGGSFSMPDGWKELFLRKGPGDSTLPEENAELYPKKDELLNELERQHNLVKQIAINYPMKKWSEPFKWRFSAYMPTMLDLFTFMCTNHEAMHLGQLSAWRRAYDMPSALARL